MAIAAVDPLCCIDGCDRGGLTAIDQTQVGGDCPSCQPAPLPTLGPPLVPGLVATAAPVLADPLPPLFFHQAVEHPPRLAA
jgi:hypothetical protein